MIAPQANPFRGEISVDMGDGVRVVLRGTFNVLAAFEAETGRNALHFLGGVEKGTETVTDMRAFVLCALLPCMPDADLEFAGDVLSADPSALVRLLASTIPAPEGDEGNGKATTKKKPPARR